MPWVVFSFANSRRPRKQNPATWVSHSAGFAIRSLRGMGEPLDIAPRGSGHLSYSAIWVRDGAPQGRGPLGSSLINGVPLLEWCADQGAKQCAGERGTERDHCRATPCVAASAIA